jgi:hypothetical protein
VLLKSETLPDDEDDEVVREAPVMSSWKNRTVTPAGGVSVTDRLTGTLSAAGVVGVVEVAWGCDWLPHPDINRRNTMVKRSNAALRIFASKDQGFTSS